MPALRVSTVVRCLCMVLTCGCAHQLMEYAAAAALERPPALRQQANSRIAVMFDEQHKARIKQQLLNQGYKIYTEGPSFFAVGSPALPAQTGSAVTATATAKVSIGRNLLCKTCSRHQDTLQTQQQRQQWQQKVQQQHESHHLKHVAGIPGVTSTEADVPRFLHMRPAHYSFWRSAEVKPSWKRTSAAAGRRLSAAVYAKRNVGSSAPTKQHRNLTGHWHHSNSYRPGPYDIWGSDIGDKRCASLDIPLGQGPTAEAVPWGVKAIGAWNTTLQSQPVKGRAIVCIIDSGLWLEHPEYSRLKTSSTGSSLDGCSTGPNCPFNWNKDLVGHGTHVAGTIGAPQNGLGVVGVISNGLDIHVVRIWNDSGDVSQGQGPYATDLVLAYDNCLTKLKSEQAKSPGKKINLVINMSYGSAGPLTVERLWIQQAAQRGDVLFVASAGNNGSFLMDPLDFYQADIPPGKKVDAGQYLSYPASYNLSEVLSVANYRCDGSIDFTSQKNRAVGIAAPGMSILSSVPKAYGAIRAHVATSLPLPNQTATPRSPSSTSAAAPQASQGAASLPPGFGTTRGGGPGKPGQPKSGLGYTSEGYREPRPIMGTRVGSTGLRKLVLCNISADVRAAAFGREEPPQQPAGGLCAGAQDAVCLVELPGNIDWYYETCLAMIKCVKSGGKGLIIWREDKLLSGMFLEPDPLDLGGSVDEFLLGTQINCGTKCPCWGQLRKALKCEQGECNKKAPPAIVVSAKHANALLNVSKAAQARTAQQQQSAAPLLVDVTVYEYNYRYYDGTSMAAPHVSGAAGLLWRLFPNCKARDIADALKSSAQRLVQDQKSADGRDWAAGSGLLRVDRAYDWIQRNNKCAQK